MRSIPRFNRSLHDGRSRFVQTGFKPKTKDTCVADWRERKGFSRDYAKNLHRWCKCGKYLKSIGNRCERRWAGKMIKAEAYDRLWYHRDRFVSSWDAC